MRIKESFRKLHQICLDKNLEFASFRLPLQESCTTYIHTSDEMTEWNSLKDIPDKKGFLIAPFDHINGEKYILLHPDLVFNDASESEKFLRELASLPGRKDPGRKEEKPPVASRRKYVEQVNTIKSYISRGYFQKAVLSRVSVLEQNFLPEIPEIFQMLCRTHPDAFVFLFKAGGNLWMGASPEPLLRLANGKISTVSMAGTRPVKTENEDVNNWTRKEVLEQEYVTRYIHDVLRTFHIRDYSITPPYVKQAGSLFHLRTDFSFRYEAGQISLRDLIETLHPTPAVAGQPKEEAISFIKDIEEHHREYYTGYLGPVGPGDSIDLFVNLRCMKITPGYLALYIGGGITLESLPEDEWEETKWKADALLEIIRSLFRQKDLHDASQTTHR